LETYPIWIYHTHSGVECSETIEMTLRYAHLAPSHKKAAVEALGNALAGEAKNTAKTA
jgi:hypothetical protein